MKNSGTSPAETTTTTTSKKWVPGLYRSDKAGHMLLVEVDPVKVTCVICKTASCPPRRADAEAFTAKHGYLDKFIRSQSPGLSPPAPRTNRPEDSRNTSFSS